MFSNLNHSMILQNTVTSCHSVAIPDSRAMCGAAHLLPVKQPEQCLARRGCCLRDKCCTIPLVSSCATNTTALKTVVENSTNVPKGQILMQLPCCPGDAHTGWLGTGSSHLSPWKYCKALAGNGGRRDEAVGPSLAVRSGSR